MTLYQISTRLIFKWKPTVVFQVYNPSRYTYSHESNLPLPQLHPSCIQVTLDPLFNALFVLPDPLPPCLSSLVFGNSFNQPVDYLPSSISHLQFGQKFNQPIDHLPPRLISLQLGYYFNHPVSWGGGGGKGMQRRQKKKKKKILRN